LRRQPWANRASRRVSTSPIPICTPSAFQPRSSLSGTHFCLGASLARLEIELIFNAIADHVPRIRLAGDPVRLRSGCLNGIKRLPVRYA
jgi:cytochrome P450